MARPDYLLGDAYAAEHGVVLLRGLQSIVRILIDQRRADQAKGLRTGGFVSGYPGSPIAGLDLELHRQQALLDGHRITHAPGLNEDLAATAVFGSQLVGAVPNPKVDGVFGMWFGKAPGVDRTGDAFRHGNFRGTSRSGGVLAVAGDDPGVNSSTLPSDSTAIFANLLMPVLYPGDIQEVLDFGLHGFAMSRLCGLGVGFRIVSEVVDSTGTVEVGFDRLDPVLPQLEVDGAPLSNDIHVMASGAPTLEVEREMLGPKLELARLYAEANGLNQICGAGATGSIGIVAPGRTYYDLLAALRHLGIDPQSLDRLGIRVLKLGLVFPFDGRLIQRFAKGLREIIVIEEKGPYIELFVKDALYGLASRPLVVGKLDEAMQALVPHHGAVSPEQIASVLARRLSTLPGCEELDARAGIAAKVPQRRIELQQATRTPYFCSGCPHSRSLAVPTGSVVGAGIGCHLMAISMDLDSYGDIVGFTHMGGEGAQWIGVAPFTSTSHFFQNVGDGTFCHSASLALRFAVASGVNMTFKILYNAAVGMTGGQDVTGALTVPQLVRLLEAEGVQRIVVTTDEPKRYRRVKLPRIAKVQHRDDLLDVERKLAATPGVTVLIHDQQCAAEKRRLRKRGKLEDPNIAIHINERVCEGCGDCGRKSNCLSVQPVETEFGRKTAIHQSSCNKDLSCLQGDCPSFMSIETEEPRALHQRLIAPPPDALIVEPPHALNPEQFTLFLTGVGGTGVVTVNQLLATAAMISGKHVRGSDHYGASQKAGPVASSLRVTAEPVVGRAQLGTGEADALLVFDVLVGTEPGNLRRADRDRTVAVVSTSQVAPGSMVADASQKFPPIDGYLKLIDGYTHSAQNFRLDAEHLALRLLGDHLATNILVAGAAYQLGLIPLPEWTILRAIELNGAAIEMNTAAFRWGRLAVARPELVAEALVETELRPGPTHDAQLSDDLASMVEWASGELRRCLNIRVADLADYQNTGYAIRYVTIVRQVAELEARVRPDSTELSLAVARRLYQLMSYKDEYEVARLHLDKVEREAIVREFGSDAKVRWHLHPPILRALGLRRKIVVGGWFAHVFRVLRTLRFLRGTFLDVFGYAKLRRVERALIEEYIETIMEVAYQLSSDRFPLALELADLPGIVNGYEHIKLASIARYREELYRLVAAYNGAGTRVSDNQEVGHK